MCRKCDHDAGIDGDPEDPIVAQQWLDQEDAWFRDTIRRCGWAIQAVFGSADTPSFAYTVGLTGFDHPEIVVFGLANESAQTLLNELGDRIRSGERLRDGDTVEIRGIEVTLFDLPNPGEVVFGANDIYRRRPEDSVPALQAVYPDDHGAWPWQPDCELPIGQQPMPGQFRA